MVSDMYTISAEIRVLRLRSDEMWRMSREIGGMGVMCEVLGVFG